MLKTIDVTLQHEPCFSFFMGKNFTNYAEASSNFSEMAVGLSKTDTFGHDISNLEKLYEDAS